MSIPFSDTTNKNGLIQHVEWLAGLSDGDISGSATLLKQVTANINRYQGKAVVLILNAQDEWDFDDPNYISTDFPLATTPLVAAQRAYTFPTSLKILKIKRADISYDGTTYFEARPIDPQEIPYGIGNDTLLDQKFDKQFPRYDMLGASVRIYPTASATDVANGGKLRIEFLREAVDFASTDTTKVGALDAMFQQYPAVGAALEYCLRNDLGSKAQGLGAFLAQLEEQMKTYYGTKQRDRNYQLLSQYVTYE